MAFQMKTEIRGPLSGSRNEGFKESHHVLLELCSVGSLPSNKYKYTCLFYRSWTTPTWGKWSLMCGWKS